MTETQSDEGNTQRWWKHKAENSTRKGVKKLIQEKVTREGYITRKGYLASILIHKSE